jgi:manganese transport protein
MQQSLSRLPWYAGLSKAFMIAGPAFAVSIGYVDPGNWATDLAAGHYGFALLWVVVLAGAIAVVVQMLTVRLAFATRETFAETIARTWPRLRWMFFLVAQFSAIATDLAEFTGIVVGLKLLFSLNTIPAAIIAVGIVFALLMLGNKGLRRLELALMGFLAAIALGYMYELTVFHPNAVDVLKGAAIPTIPQPAAIAVAIGIIGATVMPHNLFLHSKFILGRMETPIWRDGRSGIRWFSNETVIALTIATLVNGAILAVGAVLGGADGSIETAYRTIAPIAGQAAAAVFGGALLFAGIAASTTATIAGDSIAGDLAPIHIARWARRVLTLAPAAALVIFGVDTTSLLIWSQVALAVALPFAVVPLVMLCMKRQLMGRYRMPPALLAAAAAAGALCVIFDAVLLLQPLF